MKTKTKAKTKQARKAYGKAHAPRSVEERGLNSDAQNRVTNASSQDDDDQTDSLPTGNDVEEEEERERKRRLNDARGEDEEN